MSRQTRRRAMTAEEIARLLEACVPHRRLLLETAFFSGPRVNELPHLAIDHLDLKGAGLRLDAEWTKNRKSRFQPLPRSLIDRLHQFAQSGEPRRLYDHFYRRCDAICKAPAKPLPYVPSSPSRDLAKDLAAADIPRSTPSGKIDFHACRVAYVNLVLESGASLKEAQALARPATPEMTMNIYGRVREERLVETVENMGEKVVLQQKRVKCVSRKAVGAEPENATCSEQQVAFLIKWWS